MKKWARARDHLDVKIAWHRSASIFQFNYFVHFLPLFSFSLFLYFSFFFLLLLFYYYYLILFFSWKLFYFFMFRDVPVCSGMFRHVPECSVFQVLSTPFQIAAFRMIRISRFPSSYVSGLRVNLDLTSQGRSNRGFIRGCSSEISIFWSKVKLV